MRSQLATNVVFLVIISCFTSWTCGELILYLPDGTSANYTALPQQYDGNQIHFGTLNGQIIMPNASLNAAGKFVLVPDTTDSWTMEKTLITAMALNPAAIIVYSTSNMGNMMYSRSGKTTFEVTVPVMQIYWANWTDSIASHLTAAGGMLNATINDQGTNVWKDYFDSWYLPVWSATTGAFCLFNIVLAIVILARLGPLSKQIGTICCYLEILSNVLRIFWCVGPYAPWYMNAWPRNVQSVFLTISIPSSLGTIVLLAFYWHQLITTHAVSLSDWVSGRAKIPVLVFIGLLAIFEIITSSMRASGMSEASWNPKAAAAAIIANEAIYIVFLFLMLVYYSYVTIKVMIFIRGLRKLKASDRLLKRVTIRSAISIGGMILTVIGGIMVVFPKFYYTPFGNNLAHYLIFLGLNVISGSQLLAFNPATSASGSTTTRTHTSNGGGKSRSIPLGSKSSHSHASTNKSDEQAVEQDSAASESDSEDETSSPSPAEGAV